MLNTAYGTDGAAALEFRFFVATLITRLSYTILIEYQTRIGGSQREDDYARLVEKIHHHQLPEEFYQWYLDTRRFGNVPHSGFGIGLGRFLCWVCGGSDNPVHIREAITFPRMLHQLEP